MLGGTATLRAAVQRRFEAACSASKWSGRHLPIAANRSDVRTSLQFSEKREGKSPQEVWLAYLARAGNYNGWVHRSLYVRRP